MATEAAWIVASAIIFGAAMICWSISEGVTRLRERMANIAERIADIEVSIRNRR